MPDPTPTETAAPTPVDQFLVSDLPGRLESDRGPRYKETPPDPLAPNAPAVAEPWNTVTAAFFVVIAVYWLVRLRGRYRTSPFVVACLPILLVGGIGGTLYHATRTQFVYFLLDVIPIMSLGTAGSVYLIVRLARGAGWRRLVASVGGVLVVYLFLNGVIFRRYVPTLFPDRPTMPVNLSYASLAVVILIPVGVTLVRTRFRHWGLVAGALASFGIAWFCRLVDDPRMVAPPMGTHWLWHTFGAVTTAAMIAYFHRIEREQV